MRRPLLIAAAVAAVATAGALLALGATQWAASGLLVGIAVAAVAFCLLAERTGALATSDPPRDETAARTTRRRRDLEREKLGLLRALRDLRYDHEMGKISDADHAEMAARYRRRAIDVMRQLDETGAPYREIIEREVAARRQGKGAAR